MPFSLLTFSKCFFCGSKGILSRRKSVPFAVRKRSFCASKGFVSGRAAIIPLLLLCSSLSFPASFLPSWIGLPGRDDGAEVWFRHTYNFPQRPRSACISIVTTGYAELFVNGWNVSVDVLSPTREHDDGGAAAIVYDVTRFLREQDNVIAVWFSPLRGVSDERQIALSLYGKEHGGHPFCYDADGGWLCRQAPVTFGEDGCEDIDGREMACAWNADEIDIMQWVNADEMGENRMKPRDVPLVPLKSGGGTAQETCWSVPKAARVAYAATKVDRIVCPLSFDIAGDSVVYDFGVGVEGMLRVTLRGTVNGERLNIGGIRYTCAGYSDEQVIQRFSTVNARRMLVCGDENFKREQVTKVEVLTLKPYFRFSYR